MGLTYSGLPTALTFGYTYNSLGYIATYTAPGKNEITYTYDNQGQLLSAAGDVTYSYTYDAAGNILTASDGTTTHSYTYGDSSWKDLLTAYDGAAITYDTIGNPLSYYNGWTFTWQNGRQLASANLGSQTVTYAYDSTGLRTGKTVGDTAHSYLYASGKLLRESYGDTVLDFFYDSKGMPYALKVNGTVYYYITNLQGDVIYIVDSTGATVASYDYDPYGKVIAQTGDLAQINPLRYRGYYYDTETGFYYLQSRYYDPELRRFINADGLASTGQGILGNNMFAYCLNNPVNKTDYSGQEPGDWFDTLDAAAIDAAKHLGARSWESGWEYAATIYSNTRTSYHIEIVPSTIPGTNIPWFSIRVVKTTVTTYSYRFVVTIKSDREVYPFMQTFPYEVAGVVHTHPLGSGITNFSCDDLTFAVFRKIPIYVHGPNGEVRKYDPARSTNKLIASGLPVSPNKPWLNLNPDSFEEGGLYE